MRKEIAEILSNYDLNISSVESLNKNNHAFKILDATGKPYFLKLYGADGGSDFMPGENVYHTYEQIQIETDILSILSDGILSTAEPLKNKMNEYVTVINTNTSLPYSVITSFIDTPPMEKSDAPLKEMAYHAGIAAARLHLESADKLLSIASKRPHKQQDYMRGMLKRLSDGVNLGTISSAQFDTLNKCGEVILGCMGELDADEQNNVGLVHTDIRAANCLYMPDKIIPVDFSRSIFSYYLYDLGEMCAHIGGTEIQQEILRGYHEIKPFRKGQLFAVQAFLVMFLMMVMAEGIEIQESKWRDDVLVRFENEFCPGLLSGRGVFDPTALGGMDEGL